MDLAFLRALEPRPGLNQHQIPGDRGTDRQSQAETTPGDEIKCKRILRLFYKTLLYRTKVICWGVYKYL